MLGEVPSGWTREPLRSVGQFLKCQGGSKKDDVSAGVPVVRYGQLYTRYDTVIREFYTFVDTERAAAYTPLERGDVLFAGSGETLGDIGKGAVVLSDGGARGSGDLILLRPSPTVDPLFLGYAINSPDAVAQKVRLGQGSSIYHISADRLAGVSIAVPPLPEQKKIAAILSSVDEAIQATQAVIDQTRRVKEGLLQDLLTRGIGHTRFKTPGKWVVGKLPEITQIPDCWRIVPIREVARLESGHTPSRRVPEYWDGSIQWLSLHDTKRMEAHVVETTAMAITELGIANSSARLLPPGTVALSRTATVGKCVILGTTMATSQDFACYVCGPLLHNRYLLHLFRYMQHVWSALSGGSTHQTVYMPAFESLQILLPPVEEQLKIATIMDAHDAEISTMNATIGQYLAMKSGLLTDLLTGKVRVTP